MRLMQLMAGAQHGGAEAFFERLAPGLHRAGITQRLAIRRNGERARLLRVAGIEVIELPYGGLLDFRTRPGLYRAVEDFKPHVVLSWMNRASQFMPRGTFVRVGRLGGYYNLDYYRACGHLIGNTHGIVQYIRAFGWPPDRVHYLPNFVIMEKAAPVPRASLATPDDAPLALALGRLHPNKGFDVLITALAQLPRFHLWIAGEGPARGALEALAQTLGVTSRIHFLGWRQDIAALFGAADMFVCPSRIEPLGNVVIEAWAAGKPVIAAASDGPRELIKDGENGLLVPLEDADMLAVTMQKLAADHAYGARLIAAGHHAYEAEFSEAQVIGLYQEFFEKVCV